VKKIEHRREVGGMDDTLLFRRQVAGEGRDALWLHPNATVCDFGVLEDVRRGKLVLLSLRCLGFVGPQGRNVNQSRNTRVRTCMRNDGSPIGVPNKNDRTTDPTKRTYCRFDVALQCVQTVLCCHYFMTLRP